MMTTYQVWEASLHDEEGTKLRTFDTREDANAYVRENEDESLFAGYGLFIVPTSEK